MLSHAQKQQISSLPSHVQCDLWKEDRLLQQRLEELRKETAYIVGSISRSQKVLHRKLKNLEHRMSTYSSTTQQEEQQQADGDLVYRKRKTEVKKVTPKEYFTELLSSSNANRLLKDFDLKCELAPTHVESGSKKMSQSAHPYRKKTSFRDSASSSFSSRKQRSKSAIEQRVTSKSATRKKQLSHNYHPTIVD